MLLSAAIGVLLSFAASYLGRAYWERSSGSGDLLFGELMLWNWLLRRRTERRLATALELLGGRGGVADVTTERRVQLLEQLAGALEARDPYTHGHSRRVARYAAMISKRMGLSPEQVARIRTAAAVHDVGKVNTPIEILHKAGQLSDAEFAVIQRHPEDGARMVATLGDQELTDIVRHHHERLDGTGYPSGLRGSSIPLGARIIAVADIFDAITSTRPYRRANPHRAAIETLTAGAGRELDGAAVSAFRSCYSGRRSLALLSALNDLPEWLYSLFGGSSAASAVSLTKVIATAGTAAALGGAAVSATITNRPRPVTAPDASPAALRFDAARGIRPDRMTAAAGHHPIGIRSPPQQMGLSDALHAVGAGPATTLRPGGIGAAPRLGGGTTSGSGRIGASSVGTSGAAAPSSPNSSSAPSAGSSTPPASAPLSAGSPTPGSGSTTPTAVSAPVTSSGSGSLGSGTTTGGGSGSYSGGGHGQGGTQGQGGGSGPGGGDPGHGNDAGQGDGGGRVNSNGIGQGLGLGKGHATSSPS
jgi:putative nucleotidyltransferase with HDIG domain